MLTLILALRQFSKLINERSQKNKHNQTYYFFDDMVDMKNFHSDLLKIDKKSHKDIDIYYWLHHN